MENLIGNGIAGQQYYFYFSWGFYYSAGCLSYKKTKIPISNELNKFTKLKFS